MAEKSQIYGAIGGAGQGAAAGFSLGGPVGAVVGGAIGGIGGFLSGGGESKAKRIGKLNAEMERMESLQRQRIMRKNAAVTLGTAKGAIAASNIQFQGSSKGYYNQLEGAYLSDLAYEQLRSSMAQKMARLGGQAAADQITGMGLKSMLSGISAAATTIGPSLIKKPDDYFNIPQGSTSSGPNISVPKYTGTAGGFGSVG